MNILYIHFNADWTIRYADIRANGKKATDMEIWEIWEFYKFLTETCNKKPIKALDPDDGTMIHTILY